MAAQLALSSDRMGHFNLDKAVSAVQTDKKPIPVVPNKFTDEDIGLKEGEKVQHINLEKIVSLMRDKQAGNYMERHILVLQKVLKVSKNGFHLKDLPHVASIVEILNSKLSQMAELSDTIGGILEKVAVPCIAENLSDEVTYREQAVAAFFRIGVQLTVSNSVTQQQILRALISLQATEKKPAAVHKHRSISSKGMKLIIEQSGIAAHVVHVLQQKEARKSEEDATTRALALDLLERLSRASQRNSEVILTAQGAASVCGDMFDSFQHGHDHLFVISNLLWNLLENSPKAAVAQLANRRCIAQIKDAFMHQLTQAHSHYDRHLRNDLLVISTLIASGDALAPFVETGFTKALILFATYPEIKSHSPLVKNLKLSPDMQDLELKKLLFNFLVICSKDGTALHIMQEQHTLLALLEYVRPNDSEKRNRPIRKINDERESTLPNPAATSHTSEQNAAVRIWPPAFFEELQLHSLVCLTQLAPKMTSQYLLFNGGTRILMLLDWCVSSTDFGGFGNSVFAAGGRGNRRAQMRHCVRLIRALVATREDAVLYDFCDQGIIPQLVSILLKFSQDGLKNADQVDVEINCDIMFALASVCEPDVHRKEIFGTNGIDALVSLLKSEPASFNNGEFYMQLMQCTIEAIWSCVVGSPTNEDYFVERGGVFALLDLLQFALYDRTHFVSRVGANGQRCEVAFDAAMSKTLLLTDFNLPIVNAILGCLIDLCEAVKPVLHFKAWSYTPTDELTVLRSAGQYRSEMHRDESRNGPPQRSSVHLLCELWRVEEIRLKANRNPETGEITELYQPLAAKNTRPYPNLKLTSTSPAVLDVQMNLRAKIYSLFCKIGFVDIPASGMTTEDNVTLCIIEKYMDFKVGEMWSEIRQELENDSIRPVTPDLEAMNLIAEFSLENSSALAAVQHEIMQAQMHIEKQNEQKYYAELRETHFQKQRQLDNFKAFVERTSRYEALKAARERQTHQIDASRNDNKYKDLQNFHSTEMQNLNTTVFCQKHVEVSSTPKEMLLINQYRGESLENRMTLEWSQQPPLLEFDSDEEDANEEPEFTVGKLNLEHVIGRSSRSKQSISAPPSVPQSQLLSTAATASGTDKAGDFRREDEEQYIYDDY